MSNRIRLNPRVLFGAVGAVLFMLLTFASPAAALCVGGQPFLGANPSAAQKISDAPYPTGERRSIPDWYGYESPPLTKWYVQQGDGIINPSGSVCSTGDISSIFGLTLPQFITTITSSLFEIDASLLDVSTFGQEWIDNTQATVESIINSGPYSRLYQVLLLAVMPIAIITVMLLQFTQESRARGDFARAMISGGSLQSRRGAAFKEVGVIVGSVALFGAITSGGLYFVQQLVTDATNAFSNAVTVEFANFAADVNQQTASNVSPDICSPSVSGGAEFALAIEESNNLIKCNLYRIYQWTPWLVMQFGSTNVNDFAIDPNNIYEDREQLETAMAQVEEKFGPEASVLAPYLQMQILRGNNNEAFNGPEMSVEDRIQAFDGLGNTIDLTPSTQEWAQDWGGQGGFGRSIEAAMALAFAAFAFVPVTIVLLAKVLAVFGAALLPIAGIFVSVLLVVRPWRQRALKLVKWWIYCLVLPPIVTFALSLSLTMAMIVTNLVSFQGMGLFLYLLLSSIAFVGTLIYLIRTLRAKKIAGQVDGTADDPGVVSKVAGAAAPVVGTAIAPGVGTAIGSAVGTQLGGGGTEPRPSAGADDEPRPALEGPSSTQPALGGAGSAGPEPLPVGPSGVSGGGERRTYYEEDDIVDAEIIEETPDRGATVVSPAEPRALPAAPTEDTLNSNLPDDFTTTSASANEIRAAVDEGVRRIYGTTEKGAEFITSGTNRAASHLDGVATAGEQRVTSSAQGEAANLREEATRAGGEVAEATRVASDAASGSVRSAADAAATSVSESAANERSDLKSTADEARVGVSEAGQEASQSVASAGGQSARDIEDAGLQAEQEIQQSGEEGTQSIASTVEQGAHEGEERIEEQTEEASARIIRRTRRDIE